MTCENCAYKARGSLGLGTAGSLRFFPADAGGVVCKATGGCDDEEEESEEDKIVYRDMRGLG